jgi:hypothetical protein
MSWQPAETALCQRAEACDPVELVIQPRVHDLGGFSVRRVLPVRERPMVGPFVFFDQMGPAVLPAGQPVNVRPHPHIGLATLTWLFEGTIMHRDSLGYAQEIKPGEVNWMTAGSGIVHSERSPERLLGQANPLFGLQVWMALPKSHEETDPSFQHYTAADLPAIDGDGVSVVIVAGTAWGKRAPVAVYSDTLYADVRLAAGAVLDVGKEHEERALYLLAGKVEIAGQEFAPGEMLVLKPDIEPNVKAVQDTHLVLIGGARMDGPSHVWWNFVSSSKERIEQAKADWREGRFLKVPGDEVEFIPLPGS